ncbi:MAG: NAD-dependent epimerase/dehydratase family protein [Rhodospirillaceae bacterium]|nr:NAD-dependent epimerase/dehydratase family protein [Rhodospirillaceae bacterium]MBT6607441.1 NAD-dependent epimerase/dehydratase family protein [Rhodospirillaceae bacterium]
MPTPKKILVTGADGFIGSHLSEFLVRSGHQVRALVHYNAFNTWGWLDHCGADVRDGLEVLMGDVRDPGSVHGAVEGRDTVFNLAALIGIPYSYRAAASYVDTNIHGTLNILEAVRSHETARLIQTSTSEVYGSAQYVPIDESHPLQAQSPYAASKIGADQLALSYYRSFKTPVTVIRPFNTFGPRQSTRAVIPTVITQILDDQSVIKLGALEPTRDFNYVADMVRGFAAAITADGIEGEVINLSTNFEISIGDTVSLIAKTLDATISIETDPQRIRPPDSEVDRLCGANEKARELLRWAPDYAGPDGFGNAIAETAEWFRDPANRSLYKSDMFAV